MPGEVIEDPEFNEKEIVLDKSGIYLEDDKKNISLEVDEEKLVDIEKLLKEGKIIQVFPRGYSMYPLFVPGRDGAVIAPVKYEELKRGDVVLFRREGSILVMHRIWKVKKDGLYLVGDNQKVIEGPVKPEAVKGKLVTICRKGRYFSADHPVYAALFRFWLLLRPFRPYISGVAAALKITYKRVAKSKTPEKH